MKAVTPPKRSVSSLRTRSNSSFGKRKPSLSKTGRRNSTRIMDSHLLSIESVGSESIAGRGPVDATVDVMHEARVTKSRGQVTQRRVERAAPIVFLVPGERMEVAHALALLPAPIRLGLVRLLIHCEQIFQVG